MVLHVRFESLYISLLSSAKQQREMTQMTKARAFWRTCTVPKLSFVNVSQKIIE